MPVEVRRIFISSTTRDLLQYREVARDVIHKISEDFEDRFALQPVAMDTQPQDGEQTTPLDVSRTWVREKSDWVVLIAAWVYGYVPPGETCSVTEAEHGEALAHSKKVFVFLPGERRDPPEFRYRALPEYLERKDLTEWRGALELRDQETALEDFKAKLRQGRFELFRDIEDFRSKLSRTLGKALITELGATLRPDVRALGLGQPLKACFEEVKLLARLKRMHDKLHSIRQVGLRPWRENLLAKWPEGGQPDVEAKIAYYTRAPEIQGLIGEVADLAVDLPAAEAKQLPRLDRVTSFRTPEVAAGGREAFREITDAFASQVQQLFTGCNRRMGQSAGRLGAEFNNLLARTRQALQAGGAATQREQLLRSEVELASAVHSRLQDVVNKHNDWQQVHDQLERIDSTIGVDPPLHDEQTQQDRNYAFSAAIADLVDTGGSDIRALLDAAKALVVRGDSERPSPVPALVLVVEQNLDDFVRHPDTASYAALRKNFDDLFFAIDSETLRAVVSAEQRVRAIEAGLQGEDNADPTRPGRLN